MTEHTPLVAIVSWDGSAKSAVHAWEHFDITDQVRLYYRIHEGEGAGFFFWVAEWCSGPAEIGEGSLLDGDPEQIGVECLCHGTAYFDGVRHLWFGDKQTDNEGYLYYPNTSDLALIMEKLREMESNHCSDP